MSRLCTIIASLVIMLACTTVEAADWTWKVNNGLWWKSDYSGQSTDGWYYTKNCSYTSGRSCCTRCSFVKVRKISNGYGTTAGTEGWRSQLLKIKEQQKNYENRLKESANEHNEFMESVKELGLGGGASYGYQPRYANAGLSNLGLANALNYAAAANPNAAQGSTMYGYTELSEVQGNLNLALHLNQSARLAEGAQSLSLQATGGLNTLIDNAGRNQSDVAKIVAQGQAASQALSAQGYAAAQALGAAKPAETIRKESFFFKVVPDSAGNMKAEVLQNAPTATTSVGLEQRFTAIVNKKCASCHSGSESKGKLDFQNAANFSMAQWDNVWERVRHPDSSRRMPFGPDNTPGQPLTNGELLDVAGYVMAVKTATAKLQSE